MIQNYFSKWLTWEGFNTWTAEGRIPAYKNFSLQPEMGELNGGTKEHQ